MRAPPFKTAAVLALLAATLLALTALAAPVKTPPNANPVATTDKAPYRIVRIIKPEDNGPSWNFGALIDDHAKYMYILEGGYTLITEVDSGKEIAKISTCWSNGIALVPELNRGFIATGQWGLIVFDLKTHKELGRIDLKGGLGSILYDAPSKRLLVVKQGNLIIPVPADIDLKTGKPDDPIQFKGSPRSLVSDGAGMVYVTVDRSDDLDEHVAVLDTREMKIAATWPIPAGIGQASGISMDRLHSRLFIACAGHLLILSATDGHELARLPVGKVSGGWVGSGTTAYSHGKIFASCGDRTLTIVGQDAEGRFRVEQTVEGARGVSALAVHPLTGALYVPTLDEEKLHSPPGFKILVIDKPAEPETKG